MNSTTVSIEVGCEEVEIKLITSAVFLTNAATGNLYGCVQCMLSALQYILSFKHKRLDSESYKNVISI
ncbi:uncharacterized protein PHALS_01437 [Plasmopara halstedii]|uniref:Uncharacterized protein n=1 Tax=Plasmopara halstedii TaxID=4781 RepID=A0A0N7L6S8_PLAHL|nr:uncharacterized protein PHALS_01437 [Plasmopara halstedii]CEG45115.1 hypothetical protein PHALS_01437 [Plasmopara halstedii]|eukprot:XP_024581484.1 hypothetical protein PHALS_01437 [Plasmopara halstedii]